MWNAQNCSCETKGSWGRWLLEEDQCLSFNPEALHVGKGEGPQPSLSHVQKKPKGGLWLPPPLSLLTYSDSTCRLRHREGSAMLMSTEPWVSLLMSLCCLRGQQTGWRTFGCGANNNKGGGSRVQEEVDHPGIKDGRRRKEKCIKGGVLCNCS